MAGSVWRNIYALISFYCLAGCLMEHFTVYPGWLVTGTAEFTAVHTAQSNGITAIYVAPKVALTVLTLVLLRSTPMAAPVGLLWFSIAMLTASRVSSFAVQIPIQRRIRRDKDNIAIRRLITTDWVRVVAMTAHCVAVVFFIAAYPVV